MHRIDGAGHVNNMFVTEDVGLSRPPTEVTADILNALQEELASFVTWAGLQLNKADNTQLRQALLAKFALVANAVTLPTIQQNAMIAATAGGTADAITAGYTPAIAAPTIGMVLYVRAAAANTTTTPTFSPDGLTARTIVKGNNLPLVAGDIAGAGHWLALQYDASLLKWVLLNSATGVASVVRPAVTVRQTVISGPVDSSGRPAFLPASSGALSLSSQNVSAVTPLVVTAANGYDAGGAVDIVGMSLGNLVWAGLAANSVNYLYVDVSTNGTLSAGSTTLAPLYQRGGARSVAAGQAVYVISEAFMSVGNGASAVQTSRVFVGIAVTGPASVTSAVPYAYLGRYSSGWFATGNATGYQYSHNIGVDSGMLTTQCLWRKDATYQAWSVHTWLETAFARGATAAYTSMTAVLRTLSLAPPDYNTSPISVTNVDSMVGEAIFNLERNW